MEEDAKPPEDASSGHHPNTSKSNNFLSINNLHYHPSEMSELRKLAEINSSLAERLIDQRDRESARIASSYNFGLLMGGSLLSIVFVAFTLLVVYGGILKTIAVIAAVLATALLIRVVLTGEWSETSWFARMIDLMIHALGGKTRDAGD